ncbi:hypothetical protein [Nocardioides sp. NPDC006273]|uniref:hypothetical protein n=1 Tax=Nocardioides sp. NPDC006273 TaxID=3155598 RepID=UPI0033AC4673
MKTDSRKIQNRKVQKKVGQWLSIWCVVFGLLHVLWIQSFTVTVVPSVSGLDTPDAPTVILSIVFGILLLIVGGLIGHLSDSQPSVIVGRWAPVKRAILLVLSLGALVRVVIGVPSLGEGSLMTVVAEVWFLVAGVAGLVLWFALLGRKREFQG